MRYKGNCTPEVWSRFTCLGYWASPLYGILKIIEERAVKEGSYLLISTSWGGGEALLKNHMPRYGFYSIAPYSLPHWIIAVLLFHLELLRIGCIVRWKFFLGKQSVPGEKVKLPPFRIISLGQIKAERVNGCFYVKKALDSIFPDTKAWQSLPFTKLIFQNEILVSR